MPFTSVFLMDPVDRIDIDGDSTFVLMLEAGARGHALLYAHPRDLEQRGDRIWVNARAIDVRRQAGDHFTLGADRSVALDDVDCVFVRKDPPFDERYLVSTWMLDRVSRAKTVFVNDPQGIRDFNEKLSALRWPHLMPPTVITARRDRLREFVEQHQTVVVKPLLGAGGSGIVLLERGHRNVGSIIDLLTHEGSLPIEAQVFLPSVTEGDKRIILLDGAPIGAVNRIPAADDIRANMHVGGRADRVGLTERDRAICGEVGPELSRRGLVFVGLDVIGGYLTEINVTSPTGLQEIDRFDGVKLEAQILDWVEKRRASLG